MVSRALAVRLLPWCEGNSDFGTDALVGRKKGFAE